MIFDFFKNKPKTNDEEVLKNLLKSQELLNKRFEMKQMTNETYLKKTKDLRKKIEKYQKKIEEK